MVADMRISEFIERSNATTEPSELFALLEDAAGGVGFDQIAYGALTEHSTYGTSEDRAPAVVLNYPSDWVQHYFEHNYAAVDPVVVYSPRIRAPFTWEWLAKVQDLRPEEQLVLDEGWEAGLKNGVTVPLHGPFASVAVVCFASSTGGADPDAQLGRLQALATQFHTAYLDFLQGRVPAAPGVCLSEREGECLLWSARGKSSWDIGMILGISEHTVNFHFKNTMRKFGTTSRIVAVVKAIRLGLLSP